MTSAPRLLLISDFTIETFAALIRKRAPLLVTVAPFDQVDAVLLGHEAAPWTEQPDWAMVWTRAQRAIPAFARRMRYEEATTGEILEEVDAFAERLIAASRRVRGLFVASWVEEPWRHGLGLLEMDPAIGAGAALAAMNVRLAEMLANVPGVYVLDTQRWLALVGKSGFSPKRWYLNKTPFSLAVFDAAVTDLLGGLAAAQGGARKLIVLDLDETLWGGLVGEQGWENLRLGGHDPIGESLVDFQRALKALTRRGVLLAIVSKNDEAVALQAIRCHPEMLLREGDFAGWRINWGDKAANLAELAQELNLGLQSVVFIDDNPHERARVRQALPEVLVPEWPSDKLLYRVALEELNCFDTLALTQEDRVRGQMYVAERQRRELKHTLPTVDEWLAGLEIQVAVEPYCQTNAARIVQLMNRTNQMNLRTRRVTAAELAAWVTPRNRNLWALRVRDRFGDSGICGVLSLEVNEELATIVDFVVSCRVFGRKVEQVMLKTGVDAARTASVARIEAHYVPTKKNRPCFEFFQQSGFDQDGDKFVWNPAKEYTIPAYVRVEHDQPDIVRSA